MGWILAVYTILGPLFACFWPLCCQHSIFLDPKAPPTSPISHQQTTISLYFLLQVDTTSIPSKNYYLLFPISCCFPLEKSFFAVFISQFSLPKKESLRLFALLKVSTVSTASAFHQLLQHTIGTSAGSHCQLITFPGSLCLICGPLVRLISSCDCLYQLEQAYKL